MPKYKAKFYGDYERRLKERTITIEADDAEEAWIKAWKTFPEYTEIAVWEEDE